MNREILFRGKEKTNGEWVFGHFYESRGNGKNVYRIYKWQTFKHYTVDPETVGQYTGLTDRNGTKIFEGDIVLWCGIKGIVVWEGHKFYVKSNLLWDFSDDDCIEVIGNIHDNAELLNIK